MLLSSGDTDHGIDLFSIQLNTLQLGYLNLNAGASLTAEVGLHRQVFRVLNNALRRCLGNLGRRNGQ